jgi:hypothetical protein
MANPIKYSTGSETNSLKKGNFFIGHILMMEIIIYGMRILILGF